MEELQQPMDSARVIRRAWVLAAVVCRGFIEDKKDEKDGEIEVLRSRILEWLTQLELWPEVEPSEAKWLRTPLGEMMQDDVLRATWYVEGLAILSWALHQADFPLHDQQVDPPDVAESLWFLSEDAKQLSLTAQLRSPLEVEVALELLYAIHARLRLRNFIRQIENKDFTRWVEKTWVESLKLDWDYLIVQNDLAIEGKAIREVELEQVENCEHIIRERHRAILWLTGRDPIYSHISVDT